MSVSLLSGCTQLLGGKAELPQRRLYMVDVEPMRNDIENSRRPYAFQIQIKGFEAPRAYNRKEIIVRRDQYELQHDNFHHWTERPADLFTDVVKQYLRQANLSPISAGIAISTSDARNMFSTAGSRPSNALIAAMYGPPIWP